MTQKDTRIGVGILGAGPVTQAIHLPTLARLTADFRVARIMDVDASVAETVAGRVGAQWTTSQDELLADPEVEVVAICSPHPFHARQVIAACQAGKKAVLCEKPFAVSAEEATRIADVSAQTSVPIVVGAMHAYDSGWVRVLEHAADLLPHTVRSSIVLPPNARFEDFATEVVTRPAGLELDRSDPDAVAATVTGGIMGLAIHDLPLIRHLVTRADPSAATRLEVLSAEVVFPFGYLVVLDVNGVVVELHAAMNDGCAASWHLTATDATTHVDVHFTPSYVQAGSATASVSTGGATTVFSPTDRNGYQAEWQEMASIARGGMPRIPLATLIDDLDFAIQIAQKAAATASERLGERRAA